MTNALLFWPPIVFALTPSLLKWHFQVRGYSWYFLSIPLLTILWVSIQSTPNRRWPLFLLFGVISGLSIWSLELGIAFNARAVGSHFDAPKLVVEERAGRARRFRCRLLAGNCVQSHASFRELEFGPRKNWWRWSYDAVSPRDALTNFCNGDAEILRCRYRALVTIRRNLLRGSYSTRLRLLAVGVAAWPFLRSPSQIVEAIRGGFARGDQERDLLLLLLISACFVPYSYRAIPSARLFFGRLFLFCGTHWPIARHGALLLPARCFASAEPGSLPPR